MFFLKAVKQHINTRYHSVGKCCVEHVLCPRGLFFLLLTRQVEREEKRSGLGEPADAQGLQGVGRMRERSERPPGIAAWLWSKQVCARRENKARVGGGGPLVVCWREGKSSPTAEISWQEDELKCQSHWHCLHFKVSFNIYHLSLTWRQYVEICSYLHQPPPPHLREIPENICPLHCPYFFIFTLTSPKFNIYPFELHSDCLSQDKTNPEYTPCHYH